jgi:hypothetical protein
MTTPQSDPAEKKRSFSRDFFISWMTSVVVAVVVLGVTELIREWDVIKSMEILGQDTAMRLYAKGDHEAKRKIVVVLIDNETKRIWEEGGGHVGEYLPTLVGLVRHWANTVVLDLELANTISVNAKNNLVTELEKPGARVVAPLRLRLNDEGDGWEAQKDWIDENGLGKKGSNVVRAAGLFAPDDYDWVVRHLTTGVCVYSSDKVRWLRVSSLAEAAVDPHEAASCDPKAVDEERPVILFHYESPEESPEAGAVRTVFARELIDKDGKVSGPDSQLFPMKDAYVLIGQTGAETWTDQHRTPLGMKPGVLVTANAIFTMEKRHEESSDKRVYDKHLYEAAVILALGAFLALISATIERYAPKKSESNTDGTGVPRVAGSIRLVLQLSGLVVYFGIATILVGFFWTWMAASALADGVAFGTFVPVLAVGLETLMEAGEALIGSTRHVLEWLFEKTKIGALAIALLVVMLGAGSAQERAGTLTLRDEGSDVTIRRGDQLVKPEGSIWELRPFDMVVVGPGTHVWLERKGHPPELLHGPTTRDIWPAPPTGVVDSVVASFDSFWRRPRQSRKDTYAPGLSVVPRGAGDAPIADPFAVIAAGGDIARALPVGGPLRMPSAFPDAGYLTTDLSGLALAWLGGTPPYDVVVEDEDGATIAEFRSETTFLWRADWRMPQEGARLRISDANDRVLRIGLKPSSKPLAVADADALADATDLFETQPAWRYEALRRIVRLAGQDRTAAQAVLAIRLAE